MLRVVNADFSAQRESIRIIILDVLSHIMGFPEKTVVTCRVGEKTTIFEIETVKEDFGRLIGTGGKHISSLRTIVSAMSATHGFRSIIAIKDEEKFVRT